MEVLDYKKNNNERRHIAFEKDGVIHYFLLIQASDTFAKIAGATAEGVETTLEPGYEIRGDEGGVSRHVRGMFAVVYFDNYTLTFEGQEVLKLHSKRAHDIEYVGETWKKFPDNPDE